MGWVLPPGVARIVRGSGYGQANPPRAAWEQPFVASARKWIAEALEGWAEADYAEVITLAPIAVEHLGKAALWRRNPVLLAILDRANQESFLSLATEPALDNEGLRTIGLNDVLARVPSVYKSPIPISKELEYLLIEALRRGNSRWPVSAQEGAARSY